MSTGKATDESTASNEIRDSALVANVNVGSNEIELIWQSAPKRALQTRHMQFKYMSTYNCYIPWQLTDPGSFCTGERSRPNEISTRCWKPCDWSAVVSESLGLVYCVEFDQIEIRPF